jgi:hypothetical protein
MATANTCSACRFWNRHGQPRDDMAEYDAPPLPHRQCFKIIHGNASSQDVPLRDAPAFVTDGSGYAAALWTAPTFECSAFEPVTS